MIIMLGKLGLLMLSYFGYWEFFRTKCKINLYFVPIFTISSQFVVLFIAGILNYLTEATVALYAGGLLLFLYYLRKEKWHAAAPYVGWGFAFFFSAFLLLALVVYRKRFSEIDNFTHWALVVQSMLNTGRFPAFTDTVVEFTSYPLGSSAMIFYFCRLTGNGEHMQMLAQVFALLCSVLPLFAYVKRHTVLCTALIALMAGFLFDYNIPLTELQVDTLLPLAGMTAIAFAQNVCTEAEAEDKLSVYYALPVLFWTMNIKHSGLLYVVIALALLFLHTEKGSRDRKQLVLVCLILLVGRSLWNHHCNYVFPEANSSRHAMSIAWFGRVINGKTSADVWNIVKNFIGYTVSRKELRWLLAWTLSLTLLACGFTQRLRKTCFRFSLCILSLHLLYSAGVLGMYIFSMPGAEGLPSVERYMRTGDIAAYYLITIFAVSILSEINDRRLCYAVGAGLMALSIAGWRLQTGEYSSASLLCCTMEWRDRMEMPIAEYGIEKKRSYLLCINEEDNIENSEFPEYIWRYNMESSAVDQIVVTEAEQLNIEKEYDYLIILDEDNPVIQKWLQENYPDKAGETVIQHFK